MLSLTLPTVCGWRLRPDADARSLVWGHVGSLVAIEIAVTQYVQAPARLTESADHELGGRGLLTELPAAYHTPMSRSTSDKSLRLLVAENLVPVLNISRQQCKDLGVGTPEPNEEGILATVEGALQSRLGEAFDERQVYYLVAPTAGPDGVAPELDAAVRAMVQAMPSLHVVYRGDPDDRMTEQRVVDQIQRVWTEACAVKGFLSPEDLLGKRHELEGDGLPKSVHLFDRSSIVAINAALATSRPLLVRGEPGTGKSQLARAAAAVLDRTFVHYTVHANTDTRDLLYQVDAVARLGHAQLLAAVKKADFDFAAKQLDLDQFTAPGPLWWGFDPVGARGQPGGQRAPYCTVGRDADANGVVVLIDEIDKADAAVPNGLLDALGDRRFAVPGRPEPVAVKDSDLPPLIVITTNEERALPDAFLRRCWVLHLALPDTPAELRQFVLDRARAHFPDADDKVLTAVADLLVQQRDRLGGAPHALPGLAEAIDLVGAVVSQTAVRDEQLALLDEVAPYALSKHEAPLGFQTPPPAADADPPS